LLRRFAPRNDEIKPSLRAEGEAIQVSGWIVIIRSAQSATCFGLPVWTAPMSAASP
jgi:hypothetical protein